MPIINRKRRAQAESEVESEDEQADSHLQRRRQPESESPDEESADDSAAEADADHIQTLARKLVRYAISCEHSRQPIRRPDITARVLGAHSRSFKKVFPEAQIMLQNVFGMELTELPKAEKVTLQQKRSALRSENASTSSGTYVLVSILPDKYRTPDILSPPRNEEMHDEATYIGLYTMIVALITLSGGNLAEPKLDRYLRRMNADQHTPLDRTDKLLQRMEGHGYIKKIRDNSGGEEVVEFIVGPRGKTEIGEDGVEAFVKRVYGNSAGDDLTQRLAKSLSLAQPLPTAQNGTNGASSSRVKQTTTKNRTRHAARDDNDDDDDDDDEEDDAGEDDHMDNGDDAQVNGAGNSRNTRRGRRQGPGFEIYQDDADD